MHLLRKQAEDASRSLASLVKELRMMNELIYSVPLQRMSFSYFSNLMIQRGDEVYYSYIYCFWRLHDKCLCNTLKTILKKVWSMCKISMKQNVLILKSLANFYSQ